MRIQEVLDGKPIAGIMPHPVLNEIRISVQALVRQLDATETLLREAGANIANLEAIVLAGQK